MRRRFLVCSVNDVTVCKQMRIRLEDSRLWESISRKLLNKKNTIKWESSLSCCMIFYYFLANDYIAEENITRDCRVLKWFTFRQYLDLTLAQFSHLILHANGGMWRQLIRVFRELSSTGSNEDPAEKVWLKVETFTMQSIDKDSLHSNRRNARKTQITLDLAGCLNLKLLS